MCGGSFQQRFSEIRCCNKPMIMGHQTQKFTEYYCSVCDEVIYIKTALQE